MQGADIATRSLGLVAIALCVLMANTELFRVVCITTDTYPSDRQIEWSGTPFEFLPPVRVNPLQAYFPLYHFAKSNCYAAGTAVLIVMVAFLPRRLRVAIFAGLSAGFGYVLFSTARRFPEYLVVGNGHQVDPVGLVVLGAFVLACAEAAIVQLIASAPTTRRRRASAATAVVVAAAFCVFTAWVWSTAAASRFAILGAAARGDLGCVRRLLAADRALVDARDASGCTPLMVALLNGNDALARLLVEHAADVCAASGPGSWTPLHHAAGECSVETVDLLLAKGADVSALSGFGETPLHVAARRAGPDVVLRLLDHGASVTATDDREWTPLHRASHAGNVDVVDLLLKRGAVVNAKAFMGVEPLHWAGSAGAAAALLDAGAEVDTRDSLGQTPLMWAVQYGHLDVAERLLGRGADIEATNNAGETCLDDARLVDDSRVAEFLRQHGAVDARAKTGAAGGVGASGHECCRHCRRTPAATRPNVKP